MRAALASALVVLVSCGSPAQEKQSEKPKADLELLQGTWEPAEKGKGLGRFTIKGRSVTVEDEEGKIEGRLRLMDDVRPRQLDFVMTANGRELTWPCIYLIDGDELELATKGPGGARPRDFLDAETVSRYRRVKKAQ